MHLLAGLIALGVGFALFAFGYIGGGDAKLYAGAALWLGLHDLLVYTLIATILGGFLTLALLGLRQMPLPAGLARQGWISKLHDSRSGIPYGVALAAGVFAILPQAEILRLAAAG
jgi:prepilin peptidase CpaA